jgi:glycosyltransferase involved in cell wall biosynthesis
MERKGLAIMTQILLVTLVHNRKQLLGLAIKSALSQTLKNGWHHLLFNNGSTDGAEKIAASFAKKYKHIHVFNSDTNLGQQKAYNKILNEIIPKQFNSADVMAILDSDDELYPHALFEVNKMFTNHKEIGASYSGFSIINNNGRIRVPDHSKAKLMPEQFTPNGQLLLRRRFVVSNPAGHFRCYRVNALRDIGGFPTTREFATDYCIFGSIMEKYPVVKIDNVLYKFRQHGYGQVESKHSPQQTEDWKYYQAYFLKRWKEKGLI